ncbi:MAG: phage tail tube protein, partial [Gluconobacter sp.]
MSFTGATAGYSAGAQANDVIVAIAAEAEYGIAPAGVYQRLRLTGETFRCQRTRQRPEELESSWEANAAVSVQQSVNGSLSGAVSFGTYDELLACVCGSSLEDVTVKMPTDVRPNVAPAAWAGGKMLIATAGQNI